MIENVIERNLQNDPELGSLVYVVCGIRERLDLARECSTTLAKLIAEGTEDEIFHEAGRK